MNYATFIKLQTNSLNSNIELSDKSISSTIESKTSASLRATRNPSRITSKSLSGMVFKKSIVFIILKTTFENLV